MALYARDKGDGQRFDPIPEDIYHGICVGVVDLGTHLNEKFNKRERKVLITWELPDQRLVIEKEGEEKDLPRWASEKYTLSLGEKANLRKMMQSWRGKVFTPKELEGFNLQKLIKVNCLVQIMHNTKDEKTYANVNTVLPLKNAEKREPENPTMFFSFEEGGDLPEGIPEWVIDIIKQSDEWQAQLSGGTGVDQNQPGEKDISEWVDDIPF